MSETQPLIPFPAYNLIQHIAALCCYVLSFVITLIIFIIEYKKRMTISNDNKLKKLNSTMNNKSLRRFSLLALFCCPIVSFIGIIIKIPTICGWPMYPILIGWWIFVQVFLTFYQIARLKYCFSSQNSIKYGYSNKLFKLLNIWGVIILSVHAVGLQFIPNISIYSSKPRGNFGCKYETTEYYPILVTIYSAVFYVWDWIVLLLYIIKIVQFEKKQRTLKTEMNAIVYKKVRFILQKILLLTIIYEITGGAVIFLHAQSESNFLWALSTSTDVLLSSFIVFLMIEHNNDYYMKLIHSLNSCGLCCCCKSSINQVIDHQKQENIQNISPKSKSNIVEETIYETRDISIECNNNKQLSMMESELTMTNYKQTI